MNTVKDIIPEKEFPNIFLTDQTNPTLVSPSTPYQISFYQTRESLMDVDSYRSFLYSAIRRFRSSVFYRHYKAHLIADIGMDTCQMHPYIKSTEDDEVASLEMHHHVLTIFDIAIIITEHVLNTYGMISSFDLAELLRQEHEANRVNIVMLCKTCHQLYTNDSDSFKIPANIGFGKWWEFLDRYKYGITRDIAVKIYYALKNDICNADERDAKILNLLELRDNILDWSEYNDAYFRK